MIRFWILKKDNEERLNFRGFLNSRIKWKIKEGWVLWWWDVTWCRTELSMLHCCFIWLPSLFIQGGRIYSSSRRYFALSSYHKADVVLVFCFSFICLTNTVKFQRLCCMIAVSWTWVLTFSVRATVQVGSAWLEPAVSYVCISNYFSIHSMWYFQIFQWRAYCMQCILQFTLLVLFFYYSKTGVTCWCKFQVNTKACDFRFYFTFR